MSAGLTPLCVTCLRYHGVRSGVGHVCAAYPAGVPTEILASAHDHRRPYRGDHGLTYLPDATVDVSGAARADATDEQILAAGVLFVTPEGEVLLVRRTAEGDHEGEWGIPGGKLEGDETPEQAARREAEEEVGWADDAVSLTEWTRQRRDGVDFTTFLAKVKVKFDPRLNGEHDAWRWVDRAALGAPPTGKLAKADVAYSPGKPGSRCGVCVHFRAPDACEVVVGVIDPGYWCEKFDPAATARDDSVTAVKPRVAVRPDGTIEVY